MKTIMKRSVRGVVAATLTVAAVGAVQAHHSFSIFDDSQTKVFTGVVTRVNPDANHLQIFFAPMNAERKNVERDGEGKPVVWAVEMTGSAQAASDGISVSSFPPGTIFSVGLHPLRSGEHAGARAGIEQSCAVAESHRDAAHVVVGCRPALELGQQQDHPV